MATIRTNIKLICSQVEPEDEQSLFGKYSDCPIYKQLEKGRLCSNQGEDEDAENVTLCFLLAKKSYPDCPYCYSLGCLVAVDQAQLNSFSFI